MFNFVKCQFCAGHEALSVEATDVLEELILHWLVDLREAHPASTELHNILNAIRNAKERRADRKAVIANLLE